MSWAASLERWNLLRQKNHLTASGVLGMNQRNIEYISKYNPRKLFPIVDNKLKTKELALEKGVKVPNLIAVIDNHRDAQASIHSIVAYDGCCIKPAKGSGGKGILIVRKKGNGFVRSDGEPLSEQEIIRHVSNILSGLFSLGGSHDVAVIEALIEFDQTFSSYTYQGVPDLRVIIFRGFPVMAMMRLSTRASQGKANLHQGAVGVGIGISTGAAVNAVQHDHVVTHHPDTGQVLAELTIPYWHGMLSLACSCYDMSGLGYLGVDLVLDRQQGPLLLELNARPGLSIQVANGQGLVPRLNHLKNMDAKKLSVEERVDYVQAVFE